MGRGRFQSFTVAYLETDLWIGYVPTDGHLGPDDMELTAADHIRRLRTEVDAYARGDRKFLDALTPYEPHPNAPALVQIMFQAAQKAGVGPMAAVAGAFAEAVGRELENKFRLHEIIVENGGDIFLDIKGPCLTVVQAGSSPLSGKVGLEVAPSRTPIGICTSSGTVGPSLSFGRADAMTVACQDTALADAYATFFGNRIHGPSDIEPVLGEIADHPDIIAALVIVGDRMGVRGELPLKILKS